MNEMQEAIKEFLIESHENLEQLDTDFVALEKSPGDVKVLASIFRTVHTIKGSAGLLGYERLQTLAHAGESLLSRLRDGELQLTPEMTSTLLTLVDAVRQMLRSIETDGHDGSADHGELLKAITQLRGPAHASPAAAAKSVARRRPALPETSFLESVPAKDSIPHAASELEIELNLPQGVEPISPPPAASTHTKPLMPRTVDLVTGKSAGPYERSNATASKPPSSLSPATPLPGSGPLAETTVRIDVELLDTLMTLVSELVLARNQILQHCTESTNPVLVGAARQINLITSELQEEVMRTRMQPIGNILGKFPRVVRDMAVACGKQVQLNIDGSDTELDKSILEAVRDPLTHLVRNAVDHGIEPPEVRRARKKSVEGRVLLRAFHEAGQVIIEICDDGGGIDAGRIREKALERALVTADQAAAMTDQSALNLIFLPGFSTADRVSNFSGRGVGMDVVKTNIEMIGGTIDVQSRLGEGTTIKLRIPLTLAIIRALFVASAGERYAIPQVNLVELVRMKADKARAGIELMHHVPVYRYRGRLLPIVYLNRVLGSAQRVESGEQVGSGESSNLTDPAVAKSKTTSDEASTGAANALLGFEDSTHPPPAARSRATNIIVLQADDRQFGLVVDRVNDTQDIVVKPLAMQLKGVQCFAGATIMGDGQVALILDVLGLAQRSGVLHKVRDLALAEKESPPVADAEERQSVLLVGGGAGPMAVPLSAVARIEKFAHSMIERVGGRRHVQYRGEILPLIDLAAVLADRNSAATVGAGAGSRADGVQVIVYSDRGRSVGLIVDRVLDVLDAPLTVRGRASREHMLYTTVLHNQVTEVLNVESVVRAADPTFFTGVVDVVGG